MLSEVSELKQKIKDLKLQHKTLTSLVEDFKKSKQISDILGHKDTIMKLHYEKIKRGHDDLKTFLRKDAPYLGRYWDKKDDEDRHLGFSVKQSEIDFKIEESGFHYHDSISFTIYLRDIHTISDFTSQKHLTVGVGTARSHHSYSVDLDVIKDLLLIKTKMEAFKFVLTEIIKTSIL